MGCGGLNVREVTQAFAEMKRVTRENCRNGQEKTGASVKHA